MLRSTLALARSGSRFQGYTVRQSCGITFPSHYLVGSAVSYLSAAMAQTHPKPTVRTLVSILLEENCYLVEGDNKVIVIDPGDRAQEVIRLLDRSRKSLVGILCTHGHFDHIVSLGELQRQYPTIPCYLHSADGFLADSLPDLSRNYGVIGVQSLQPTLPLQHEMPLNLFPYPIRVLHTPGHSPGSCCFLINENLLFTGDTLFAGSVGRTDLPGGDSHELFKSIEKVILSLAHNDVKVLPGHGPPSTIQTERDTNPYLLQSMKIDF